jgi:hypothetical protein
MTEQGNELDERTIAAITAAVAAERDETIVTVAIAAALAAAGSGGAVPAEPPGRALADAGFWSRAAMAREPAGAVPLLRRS